MKKENVRRVIVFGNHFKEFRRTLDREALKKMYQVITLIMRMEVVPVKFLRAIKGRKGLYEIRSESGGNAYRVFCFFDEGQLVVLLNGFLKKTRKAPIDQLNTAEALMKQYFEQKTRKGDEYKKS